MALAWATELTCQKTALSRQVSFPVADPEPQSVGAEEEFLAFVEEKPEPAPGGRQPPAGGDDGAVPADGHPAERGNGDEVLGRPNCRTLALPVSATTMTGPTAEAATACGNRSRVWVVGLPSEVYPPCGPPPVTTPSRSSIT